MKEPPFFLTTEAAAHVEKRLLEAQRQPKLLALVRVLWGIPAPGYPYRDVYLGWVEVENIDATYVEFEVAGFLVFIHQSMLEFLNGKTISLEKDRPGSSLVVRDPNAPKWTY